MCLAPKIPPPPEPPPPPPATVTSNQPTTVKPIKSRRAALQQATQGPAGLTIPLNTGGGAGGSMPTGSMTNLNIGK
jgi:hypothetical protein